ncbi:MAG: hypothetical protein ACKN9R_06270 [Candidatus Limnocylindrus sp.]
MFITEALSILDQKVVGPVSWDATGQNQDLRYVKAGLAKAARELGANAIVKFEYGQRGKTNIFGGLIDAEKWFGSGIAVKVSPSLLSEVPDRSSEKLTWKGW